jgi:hypothetical protein
MPLPHASDFEDIGELRRALAVMLHSAGRPSWDRQSSIPNPQPVPGVVGLEARALSDVVAGAGAAFVARLRRNNHVQQTDEKTGAAA